MELTDALLKQARKYGYQGLFGNRDSMTEVVEYAKEIAGSNGVIAVMVALNTMALLLAKQDLDAETPEMEHAP